MPSDIVLFALFIFGFGGSLIGVAFLGTVENARPVFLPMMVAFLYLLTIDDPTDREVSTTLNWLSWIATAYTAMNAIVNLQLLPGLLLFKQYRNASVSMVALAVATAVVLGNRRRLALVLALAAVIFVTYPSATSVFMATSVVLTFYITGKRSSGLRTIVVVVSVVTVSVLALANFDRGVASPTSTSPWSTRPMRTADVSICGARGSNDGAKREFFGNGFAGEVTAVRERDERSLPFHNDFVLFLANGGIVGLGLLVAWVVLTELTLLRRYRGFVRAQDMRRAGFLRAILVCLNAFVVAMALNPGPSRGIEIGHDLRALRDRDVARRILADLQFGCAGLRGRRTRGAIRLNAERFRRCASRQYPPCTASEAMGRGVRRWSRPPVRAVRRGSSPSTRATHGRFATDTHGTSASGRGSRRPSAISSSGSALIVVYRRTPGRIAHRPLELHVTEAREQLLVERQPQGVEDAGPRVGRSGHEDFVAHGEGGLSMCGVRVDQGAMPCRSPCQRSTFHRPFVHVSTMEATTASGFRQRKTNLASGNVSSRSSTM